MRKLLAITAILATLTAAGCSVAANAGDTMERGETLSGLVTLTKDSLTVQ